MRVQYSWEMFNNCYVCDTVPDIRPRNNRVQLFDAATRKYLASVGRKGQIRPGRMQAPEGVTFVDGRREV